MFVKGDLAISFRIAVIGCGNMAVQGHGPAYRKYASLYPDVELVACCDIDAQKAGAFQARFGFSRYYTNFRLMLKREKPDAVCLLVPPEVTASLAVEIMRMGFPLLVEKPPGLNARECQGMVIAAQESGVVNQVAFNRRYTPLLCELDELLTSHFAPLEISNIRYDFQRVGRTDEDFSTTAIHGIDAVRFLARSDYAEVRFRYREYPDFGRGVADIFMDCVMKSGTTTQLNFCPVTGVAIERATVNARDHTFFLYLPMWKGFDSPGRLRHIHRGKVILDLSGEEASDGPEMFEAFGFYAENKAFFDSLRSGQKPAHDIPSALQSVEIADCIRHRQAHYTAD